MKFLVVPLLRSFFSRPSGFGSAGISRQRECGALTILGSGVSGLQRGVEVAEVGISVRRHVVRYFSRVREELLDNLGERKALVVSTAASREVTIEGEVIGATGVMAYTFLTACTTANDITDFGSPTGILLMVEATVTQERAGWRDVSIRLESDPGITAVS